MSKEYDDVYYCSSNQMAINYVTMPNSLSVNNANLITPDIYDTLYNLLKNINNFGDYDKATRVPNINNKLSFTKLTEIIPVSYYNDIINRLQSKYSPSHSIPSNLPAKEKVILGSYFSDILTILKDYKLSETRYYKKYRGCCDCNCNCNCNSALCSKPRDYCGLP